MVKKKKTKKKTKQTNKKNPGEWDELGDGIDIYTLLCIK